MKIIVPKTEGNYLTQASLTNEEERIFTDKIYLAVNDTEDSWRECTQDEKDKWEEEHQQEPPTPIDTEEQQTM